MGSVKEYMMELSDKLGKEFEDITDRDMELDFYNKAQETFWNDNSTQDELERAKPFLPSKADGKKQSQPSCKMQAKHTSTQKTSSKVDGQKQNLSSSRMQCTHACTRKTSSMVDGQKQNRPLLIIRPILEINTYPNSSMNQ